MSNELKITNEDIQLLKEMKENCLKADVYEDEKRLLKANTITKFLLLQNNWNELKEHCNTMLSIFEKMSDKTRQEQLDKYVIYDKFLSKMQELENRKV